jgi:ribosomal protein S18 acetylase RimI-like enzyme
MLGSPLSCFEMMGPVMMGAMICIRAATLDDLPGAYRVCLLTGDAGEDASRLFRDPDLLGHVYVGPYVVGEPDLALVVADDDGVAGYCLAARDTRMFAEWAEREWWPSLRARYPRRSDATPDAELVDLLHDPPIVDAAILDQFPAHLHLDLLERVRGRGIARRLIERQLGQLAHVGGRACHLVVAASNANAIGFYEHLGWHVVERRVDALVMGITW